MGKYPGVRIINAWGGAQAENDVTSELSRINNPFRFQGQYADDETGLHYNWHRYYDPELGRYISRDPVGLFGGLNSYQYAPDPIHWVDPLGLKSQCKKKKAGRFSTADGAGKAAMKRYNSKSIRDNLEYGGLIYKTSDGRYDYTKATRGDIDGVSPWSGKKIPKGSDEVGYWQIHGNYSKEVNGILVPTGNKADDVYDSDNFSDMDIDVANDEAKGRCEYFGYIGTPSGKLKGYNAKTKKTYTL